MGCVKCGGYGVACSRMQHPSGSGFAGVLGCIQKQARFACPPHHVARLALGPVGVTRLTLGSVWPWLTVQRTAVDRQRAHPSMSE